MNSVSSHLVTSIGWALVHFVWQGALIGLVAAALLGALRGAHARVRYAVAIVALLACVAVPIASVLATMGDSATTTAMRAGAIATTSTTSSPAWPAINSWQSQLQPRLSLIVLAWSLGCALLALRFALGFAWVDRLQANAHHPDAQWQARLDQLAVLIGLKAPVPLLLTDRIDSPVAAGWWRPVVLVPSALLARMPVDLLEALLAHELAHIKRHDYLVNLLQGAIETLLFYHPVVWWLSRRIRSERELIADDIALRAIPEPRRLALALQQLDRLQAGVEGLAFPNLAPAAHGGNLMNRISRLVRPNPSRATWKSALPLLLVIPLCVAVVAQATTSSTPAQAKHAAQASPRDGAHPAYALVRDGQDGMMLSGDIDDMADVKQTRQHLRGDFLWFRDGKTAYVVQDPALLARAREAWAPSQALGAKMEVLSEQMRPHSEHMEALGAKMEKVQTLSQPMEDDLQRVSKQMEPLAKHQQQLAEQMRVLADRMRDSSSESQRESLNLQMEKLQDQMQPLNEQMSSLGELMSENGRKMQAAHQPLQDLGEQMRIASEPMHALGEKMRVLGEQQEKTSHQADAQVRQLLQQALRDGKAQPSRSLIGN